MATTSLWKIQRRLDQVIKYTTNEEKTKNEYYGDKRLYDDLHNVLEYAKADYKTEKQLYVSGINCSEENALKEMITTKKYFGKENGILAFHGYQSFKEGEVTPELAHEIGVKLAEELWGDNYEVIVSTHLNTKQIHNHFVVNSVSFKDGKKYRNTIENYALMRKVSDDLCLEYGLSIVDEKNIKKNKIDYSKFYSSYTQKTTYYSIVKEDVDFAIKQAKNYEDFKRILNKMNYQIRVRANKLSLLKPPYKRNIRIERSFGEEYTIENIKDRIKNTIPKNIPFPEVKSKFVRYYNKSNYKRNKFKDRGSFYRLYQYYCYLLNVYPKSNKRVIMSNEMKKEIYKMDKMSEEMKFLARNKIKTSKELFQYKENIKEEINNLLKNRASLRKKKERETNSNTKEILYKEILSTTEKINYLKKEMMYCDDIEKRTKQMQKNLIELQKKEKELKKEKNKERNEKNECFK